MRKQFLALLAVPFLVLASCQNDSATSSAPPPPTMDAAALRANNEALLQNVRKLKALALQASNAPVAGRTQADGIGDLASEIEKIDFGQMKTQVVTAMKAEGMCQGMILFVSDLIDFLDEVLKSASSDMTEAEASALMNKFQKTFAAVIACIEPLASKVAQGEGGDDAQGEMPFSLDDMMSLDKCICSYGGNSGGSIFGNSAALVYATYGAPELSSVPYSAPGSSAGDTYSAPSSPAGETYGAPTLFP